MDTKTAQNFSDIARLINYQQTHLGEQESHSLNKLEKALPSILQDEFLTYKQYNQKLLSKDDSLLDKPIQTKNSALDKLIHLSKHSGVDQSLLIAKFLHLVGESQQITRIFIHSLKNSLSYAISLAVVCVIVFSLIITRVLPQFADIYASFGAELPEFTGAVLSLGQYGFLLLLFFAVVLALSLFVLFKVKRCISTLVPLPNILTERFNSPLLQFYEHYIYLQYINILHFSGMPYDQAKGIAKQAAHENKTSNMPMQRNQALLDVAADLGALELELEHQLEQLKDMIAIELNNFRKRLNTGLMAFLGVTIGACLLAVYLPIFGMGSII